MNSVRFDILFYDVWFEFCPGSQILIALAALAQFYIPRYIDTKKPPSICCKLSHLSLCT